MSDIEGENTAGDIIDSSEERAASAAAATAGRVWQIAEREGSAVEVGSPASEALGMSSGAGNGGQEIPLATPCTEGGQRTARVSAVSGGGDAYFGRVAVEAPVAASVHARAAARGT